MKKILFLFLLCLFSVNVFACLQDRGGVKKLVLSKVIVRITGLTSQQQQIIVDNIVNNATTLQTNTNLSNESINKITDGLANSAPASVLLQPNRMEAVTTNVATAANNASAVGFDNLQVLNVGGSGTDGVAVTMQQRNAAGGTYTVQVDTSSTTPQNATTGAASNQTTQQVSNQVNSIYIPRTTVYSGTSTTTNSSGQTVRSLTDGQISNTNNSVTNGTTDLLTGQSTNGTATSTGGSAIVGNQIVQNGQSTFVGGGVTINQNTNVTYSANPTITNEATVNFTLSNGTKRNITVATGQMQVVQKTTTNIQRANGTIQVFETKGQPIVNMNLTTETVKRITINNQVLQGRDIYIENFLQPDGTKKIRVDNKLLYVQPDSYSNVTQHTVYVMNGVPSTFQVQEGDVTGSVNECTYYVNGVDTGVVANMVSMTTITLSQTNSTITGTQITLRQVDGVNYYVVDGLLTNYVYNTNDRSTLIWRPVDDASMNTKNIQTITNVVVKNASGTTLLNSNNLGQQKVQTITLTNGETISGTIGKTTATRITYNGNQYIGLAVTAQNNILYLDGESTGVSVNANNVVTDSVQIYVLNGKTTTHVVKDGDVQSSKMYYTDNGQLTNIEVDKTHQIISNTTTNNTTNLTNQKTFTIKSNGNTYTANNISKVNTTTVTDSNGNIVVAGNTISTKTSTYLYYNGAKLGLNSSAKYGNRQVVTAAGSQIISATVNGLSNNSVAITQSGYYVPKYNGYYFVVDGKLMLNNGNGSFTHVDTSKSNYVAVQYPLWATLTHIGRFSESYNSQYKLTSYDSYWSVPRTRYDSFSLLPTCGEVHNNELTKGKARQISCGNGAGYLKRDSAGSPVWSAIGIAVTNGGTLAGSYGSSTLDSNTDWKQVQMVSEKAFVALKNNGDLYKVIMSGKNKLGSITNLNISTKFKTIAAYRGGSNYIYAIGNDNYLYRIDVDNNANLVEYYDLQIGNISKIVVGKTICVALNSTNHIAYVINTSSIRQYQSGNDFNIRDIGVSRDEALFITYGGSKVTQIPTVTINGKTYDVSDTTTKNQTVYVVDGTTTSKIYSSNHTRSTQTTSYKFKDIQSNVYVNVPISSQIDYKMVSVTQSGSVAAIVTTATNENGNQTYYINGIDTGINFSIDTTMNATSRQVYYIGDVNTNVTVTPNDDLQLRGDYWTINGYNTNVRFYGLGQMAVQVADVTPGELDENEQTTGSTVVVPLSIKAQIVRFNESRPITQIRLQYKKLEDTQWTNLKVLTNTNRRLQNRRLQTIFGRYVNVPVSKQQSFILRCNITDGTESTVTASSLQPQQGNIFYWAFIRSNYDRPN